MTPEQVFDELCTLYPKKWDAAGKVAWARIYAKKLAGIKPEVLAEAYYKAVGGQKFGTPPTPQNILDQIATPSAAPKQFEDSKPYPHSGMANKYFMQDPGAQTAIKEGWHLGLWQFIGKQGRTPSIKEAQGLAVSNKLFHDSHSACINRTKINTDRYSDKVLHGQINTLPKSISIAEKFLPMFEKFTKQRNELEERFKR